MIINHVSYSLKEFNTKNIHLRFLEDNFIDELMLGMQWLGFGVTEEGNTVILERPDKRYLDVKDVWSVPYYKGLNYDFFNEVFAVNYSYSKRITPHECIIRLIRNTTYNCLGEFR